jgi:serine protease
VTYPLFMRKALLALTTALLASTAAPAAASPPLNQGARAGTDALPVVAVLDTGITEHRALGWRIRPDGTGVPGGVVLPGYDFVSDPWAAADGDGWDSDPTDRGDGVKPHEAENRPLCRSRRSSWHGTNVAGTIAARGVSPAPSKRLTPDFRILPVRVLGRCGGNTADVAAGLLWAIGEPIVGVPINPHPARIVNLSLSGTAARCPRALQAAIDIAHERKVPVVVAAGSANLNTIESTPANCDGVVVVGATDKRGQRSPVSNFGDEVTLSALGGDMSTGEADGIFTTTNQGAYRPRLGGYGYYQGSSAAAARVAGALAHLASQHPQTSGTDLLPILMSHLDPFTPGQCDVGDGLCGDGIVNLARLLAPN